MADPKEYTLVRNLQTALGSMTVATGYHYAVAVTVVKLDPDHGVESLIAPDGARPFVIIEVKPDVWTYEAAGRARIVMPIAIHWVSDSTATSDESRLLEYLRGCADVERAVTRDITRGGIAVDTKIVKRTFDTAVDGTQVWAIIDVEVLLHRVYGSP